MNNDQVRNWQLNSVQREIRRLQGMLDGMYDQTDRKIINQEVARLYGILRSLTGEPETDEFATPAFGMPPVDAA
jgi:hypothetical protein